MQFPPRQVVFKEPLRSYRIHHSGCDDDEDDDDADLKHKENKECET